MRTQSIMNRRNFLKTSTLTIAGTSLLQCSKQEVIKTKDSRTAIGIKEYRTLGRTGFKVSDIGAGKTDNPNVLRALMDAGVNYIDTAESYGEGQSERVIGEAITGRDRKSIFINSKLKIDKDPTKEEILFRFNKCLERLKTEYLDCMMIHSCPNVKTVNYQPFHDAMGQLKKEGKVRFVGISCHGNTYNETGRESMEEVLLSAVNSGHFDVMIIVYNFLNHAQGGKVLDACGKNNIGTVVIKVNPVGSYYTYKEMLEKAEKEGKPTETIKIRLDQFKKRFEEAQNFIEKNNLTDSEAIRSAAYRFALDNKNVQTALFSFSNFDQIDSLLKISGTSFSDQDRKIQSALSRGCSELYCRHACGICERQCPGGVPINTIMRYNHYFEVQGKEKEAMKKYAALPTSKADRCYHCSGTCENACPYGVPIQGLLLMAHNNLSIG